MRNNKAFPGLLVALLVLAFALAACGPLPTNVPAPTTGSIPGNPTTRPTAAPAPVPTVTPAKTSGTTRGAETPPTPAPLPGNQLPWQPFRPGNPVTRPDLSEQQKAMLPAFKGDVQLVQNLSPSVYNIALRLEVNGDTVSAKGSEQLFYTNDTGSTLDNLYLWLWANAPDNPDYKPPISPTNVRVNGQPTGWGPDNGGAQIKVVLNPLPPGATAVVELDFSLAFPQAGNYEYFKYDTANRVISLTDWYPQLAIYNQEYNGWDRHPYNEQGDITNSRVSFFNLWLTAPADQTPVINGRTLDTIDNPDGTRTYRVVTGPMRDLVATFSPRYQSVTAKAGDITVTSYFADNHRPWGERTAQIAANALLTYNDLFGPYPYTEFKIAESHLVNFGGFEFPGMILITPRYYTDANIPAMEYVIPHEVAHQWWYGLVGSDQILHPWQDEGIAQYSPVFYFERFKGKAEGQRILNGYMLNGFRAAIDSGRDDIVDQSVYAWKDANGYIFTVYNKAGAFYNAYRARFGDEAFKRFTRAYLDRARYKIAGENDILEALKVGAGPGQEQAVEDLFRHWIKAREGEKDR